MKKQDDIRDINTHYNLYTKPFLVEGWKPECKQDVVELLMEVQIGYISCRRASDILFPEFGLVAQR